ncbi:MAG: hypothetical protein ACRC42_00155 [Mycoplasma sp.]
MAKAKKIQLGYDIPRIITMSLNGSNPSAAYKALTSIPVSKLPQYEKEIWIKFISSLKYDEKYDEIYLNSNKAQFNKMLYAIKANESKGIKISPLDYKTAEEQNNKSPKNKVTKLVKKYSYNTIMEEKAKKTINGRKPNNTHLLKD